MKTATSPERVSPSCGAPAIPRSSAAGQSSTTSGIARPLDEGHRRALARRGLDLELVDEPPRARQPEPEPAAGRVAVGERAVEVLDPRPLVARDHAYAAAPVRVADDLDHHLAA